MKQGSDWNGAIVGSRAAGEVGLTVGLDRRRVAKQFNTKES